MSSVRLGAVIASLGSLFQYPTTHWEKNLSLMSNLNLHWHNFKPFPKLLLLSQRRDQCLPLLLPLWGSCRLQWGLPSVPARLCKLWCHCSSSVFPSRPFSIFIFFFRILSDNFVSFLYCGAQTALGTNILDKCVGFKCLLTVQSCHFPLAPWTRVKQLYHQASHYFTLDMMHSFYLTAHSVLK